jgi:putative membrane protein
MKRSVSAWACGIAGAALLVWLLAQQEWSTFGPALLAVGWGMAAIALFHVVPMLLDAAGWRCLLPQAHRPTLSSLLEMRWYAESVNALLPVAQIGGDVLRGRLVNRAGVPGAAAAASIVADLTLSVLSLVAFVALGAGLLALRGYGMQAGTTLAAAALYCALSFAALYLLQRQGRSPRLLQLAADGMRSSLWRELSGHAATLRQALAQLANDRRALAASSCWQFAAWAVGAGEIWLSLHFLGHPVSLADALLLESLLQAVRNAAFVVPGALGVQDGGLMMLAPLAGLGPETGLAVSLLKRVRELALGVPGLLCLYWRFARTRMTMP